MGEYLFRAELWEHSPDDAGSWHFLTVPGEVSDDIRIQAGPREGFGSIRVVVRIGDTTWRTSLFPDSAAGSLVLPVKKSVRRAEDLHHGTACDVTVEILDPSSG